MEPLTVIARLTAKDGSEEKLRGVLQGLVAPTRAEAGCLTYELHRSHDQPNLFMFTESWASRSAWEAHMKAPHLVAFGEQQAELCHSWELFTGEKI
ncbi:putative quinol monooxygenase [Lichenihabitans sp. Uapishka_5]|uniref:putative quinol monooxygenase n=1 Tax=Lichenihabitans sp. Uapishka_5 TaxID=3037302 RepID=UPI0029E81D7C|nr:putative quinol monooxygenase [Lichenihabitans sp. Uapishka_5]MDX7949792.1 putative quinol monooxygenase [Lichenihabitans sp. Uapishka_5]